MIGVIFMRPEMIGVSLRRSLLQSGELHKCNDILVSAHQ
jgi:hypothetical protein